MSEGKPLAGFAIQISQFAFGVVFIGLIAVATLATSAEPEFPPGQSCAAWKTKKRMFLVRSVEPVGVSCDLKVQRTSAEVGWGLQISIPVASFNSGEAERDAEVVKLLKGDGHPNILISSETLAPQLIEQFHKGESVQVSGRIEVGGKAIERSFTVLKDKQGFARVSLKTQFKDFDLEPPQVAGGVVAKVRDDLELHAQIQVPDEVKK